MTSTGTTTLAGEEEDWVPVCLPLAAVGGSKKENKNLKTSQGVP